MLPYHLVSWGANSHGQLGQDILSDQCILPQEVNLSGCSLKPENIKKIVGGAGHTLILDINGHIYSCGLNNKGQAGSVDVERGQVLTFQQIRSLERETIVDVCCGWDSSAALTRDGDLYVWGSNRYGQLGLDISDFPQISPACRLSVGEKVKRVSMGLRHTAVVTENGKLYTCGANNKGQLGVIDPKILTSCTSSSKCSKELKLQGNVEDVACGQHHTIVITRRQKDTYDAYVFGDNKHGQLGFSSKISSEAPQSAQTNLSLDAPVQVYSGWNHINILSNGTVFSWGRNDYGQLGRLPNPDVSIEGRLQCVDTTRKVTQLAVGSEHNVSLADDRTIMCWGWNEHGNCGNGNTENVLRPEVVPLPSNFVGVLVGAGTGHSFAVIKDTS